MKIAPTILIGFVGALVVLAVAIGAKRLASAHGQVDAARAVLGGAQDHARRIIELRSHRQLVADRRRPDQDVIQRVNDALTEAGMPLERLEGVQPAGDTALPGQAADGPGYRRQSVQVTVTPMTESELGAFLSAWRSAGGLWTPTRIDLSHSRAGPEGRYTLTMVISTTYVAEP